MPHKTGENKDKKKNERPFSNKAQMGVCFSKMKKGKFSDWDCIKQLKKTHNVGCLSYSGDKKNINCKKDDMEVLKLSDGNPAIFKGIKGGLFITLVPKKFISDTNSLTRDQIMKFYVKCELGNKKNANYKDYFNF